MNWRAAGSRIFDYATPSNYKRASDVSEFEKRSRRIVGRFMRSGGFSESKNLRTTHSLLIRQIEREPFLDDQPWESRYDVLSAWALICLETVPPAAEQKLLCVAIALAQSKATDDQGPNWFGRLAIELFLREYPGVPCDESPDPRDRTIRTRAQLFDVITQAFKETLDSISDPRRVPLPTDWLNNDAIGGIFGHRISFEIKALVQTKRLLEKLWRYEGASEALILLVLLGMESKSRSKQRLREAEQDSWVEVRSVASFLLGLLESQQQPSGRFRHVRSPITETGDDWCFLSSIALKSEVISDQSPTREKHFLWEYSKHVQQLKYRHQQQASWPSTAGHVREQADKLAFYEDSARDLHERSIQSPDFYDELAVELAFESLRNESGQLLEAFLKWCLVEWSAGASLLSSSRNPRFRNIEKWDNSDFVSFIGHQLGLSQPKLGVGDLLTAAGQNPQLKLGFGKRLRPVFLIWAGGMQPARTNDVWDSKPTFPELLVANAVAAACNPDHVFRRTPTALLREACGAFGGVNLNRRPAVHWYREAAGREQALFWSWAIQRTVTRLMDNVMPAAN